MPFLGLLIRLRARNWKEVCSACSGSRSGSNVMRSHQITGWSANSGMCPQINSLGRSSLTKRPSHECHTGLPTHVKLSDMPQEYILELAQKADLKDNMQARAVLIDRVRRRQKPEDVQLSLYLTAAETRWKLGDAAGAITDYSMMFHFGSLQWKFLACSHMHKIIANHDILWYDQQGVPDPVLQPVDDDTFLREHGAKEFTVLDPDMCLADLAEMHYLDLADICMEQLQANPGCMTRQQHPEEVQSSKFRGHAPSTIPLSPAEVLQQQGAFKQLLSDPAGALADLDAAVQLGPMTALTYQYRGLVNSRLGNQEAARQDRLTEIVLGPDRTTLVIQHALFGEGADCSMSSMSNTPVGADPKQQSFKAAISALDQAEAEEALPPAARAKRGFYKYLLGDDEGAKVDLLRGIPRGNSEVKDAAIISYVTFLAVTDSFSLALLILNNHKFQDPAAPAILQVRGVVKFMLRDWAGAIADLNGRAHTKHLLWKLAAARCNMGLFDTGVQDAIAASWL